jgi:hypothetical protein
VLSRIRIARRVNTLRGTVVFVGRSGCLALGFLILGGSGCLLYTDAINHPPQVELTGDSETTWNTNPRPRYHAEAKDPDQSADSLTYEWRRQLGACPAAADVMVGAPVGPSAADFQNDVDFSDPFCVWVVVRDKLGATAYASTMTTVKHQETTAVIEVVAPEPSGTTADLFPLLSTVHLSGAKSSDPENSKEKLTFHWSVVRGIESVDTDACPQLPDSEICFVGDKQGPYVANLMVEDSRNGKAMATKSVTIDQDRAPCIVRTDPMFGLAKIVRNDTDLISFEVNAVSDDVDPFPPVQGRPSMFSFKVTWWKMGDDPANPPGRRTDDMGQTSRTEFRRMYFNAGDQAFVRIQVNDRVGRDFGACPADKSECALDKDRPTCFQWVTWKIDVRPGQDVQP